MTSGVYNLEPTTRPRKAQVFTKLGRDEEFHFPFEMVRFPLVLGQVFKLFAQFLLILILEFASSPILLCINIYVSKFLYLYMHT